MRTLLTAIFISITIIPFAQPDSLHTAANCTYMTQMEKDMIYEINQLRSNPSSYLQYILPLLSTARNELKNFGKGGKNYSLTFSSTTSNGQTVKTVDTTWHYINEEEVRALSTLADSLKHLKPLRILQPDSGIYLAAVNYVADQRAHDWTLLHEGSDGSYPWDRITLFSPRMASGNENIGAMSGTPSARDIVLLLLIDSGIPGYGHRYNILNPLWTHIACKQDEFKGSMWWLQEFGRKKE